MLRFKNVLMEIVLIISCTTLQAGNGSAGWGAFGGALGGSILGNAISQPRQPRTQVVQVPVQQAAPAQRDADDDSAAARKLRRENKALAQEVDDLADEVIDLKKQLKQLKAENASLKEHSRHHNARIIKSAHTTNS